MKYNTKEVTHNGQRVIFVTRGKAKPFTTEEAEEFLGTKLERIADPFQGMVPKESAWAGIPDTKQRKIMFIKDMKFGIDYCISKYGATREELIAEAERILPYFKPGV